MHRDKATKQFSNDEGEGGKEGEKKSAGVEVE